MYWLMLALLIYHSVPQAKCSLGNRSYYEQSCDFVGGVSSNLPK